MKRTFFSIIIASFIVFTISSSIAQEIKIERFVVGTGGMVGNVNADNITMSGITGQIAIEKIAGTEPVYNNMTVDVYQGFWVPVGDFFTGVEDNTNSQFGKLENYPNPFSSSTIVKYNLPAEGNVSLKVYDMLGNVVKTLYSGHQNSGDQEIPWNGKDEHGGTLSSGTYIYELTFTPSSIGVAYNLKNIMVILK